MPACDLVGRPALSPHPKVALLGKFDCRERKQTDRHRQINKLIMTMCMDAYTCENNYVHGYIYIYMHVFIFASANK